jgi:pyrimidine-specific ribonucleoside hydrolase
VTIDRQKKKIPIWLDTDPGVDDAAAIFLAARMPEIEVVGVSAVAGNVNHDHTFRNARDLVCHAGLKAKVYPGSDAPLIREPRFAPVVHGSNGIRDVTFEPSPAPVETMPAWEAIYEAAKQYHGELILVPVGPLTNIAKALLAYPDICDLISRIVLMGGSVVGGNTTPSAEFNICFDPDAAEIVFDSGVPITMVGLDVTMKANIGREHIAEIAKLSESHRLLSVCLDRTLDWMIKDYDIDKLAMHDPCTLLYVVYPDMFTAERAGVRVETKGPLTRGRTVSDLYSDFQFPEKNCDVVLDLDLERLQTVFMEIMRREPWMQ